MLLPPYHTVAFLLLFIFSLGKSCWVLYVFTNSFILQKTQFASPLTLLCYATLVLILDKDPELLETFIFRLYSKRKVSPKQHMFATCRGQWNVILVLPSIRVKLRNAHFSAFWHSLEIKTKEQLNYPRIPLSPLFIFRINKVLSSLDECFLIKIFTWECIQNG